MGLSCYCDDDGDWYHTKPADYSVLKEGTTATCCSCHTKIEPGEIVNEYDCWRYPETEEEEDEYGDEVPVETLYHCEKCADIYWNLDALGFCLMLSDDMRQLMKDYVSDYVRRA